MNPDLFLLCRVATCKDAQKGTDIQSGIVRQLVLNYFKIA